MATKMLVGTDVAYEIVTGGNISGPMMKILIAYDGSSCSESALDDLERSGLPRQGEALIICVAEVWLPPPNSPAMPDESSEFVEGLVKKYREKGERGIAQAETMVNHARERVCRSLPGWDVKTKATYGSPAWEILSMADEFGSDLIFIGSHGRSALGRFVLGSISQKVLTEAFCSVRIARGRVEVDDAAARIEIGFDGSPGSYAAVDSVADRKWPAGSEARIIVATDTIVPAAIGRFVQPFGDWAEDQQRSECSWITELAERSKKTLEHAGLNVTIQIIEGDPNKVLIREAEKWHADCIFVGANAAGGRLDRFLLGSTSAAVASRAHCSVEIVRKKRQM